MPEAAQEVKDGKAEGVAAGGVCPFDWPHPLRNALEGFHTPPDLPVGYFSRARGKGSARVEDARQGLAA